MLNAQQARVIDPILTAFARGYQNNTFAFKALFPEVFVGVAGGQVIQFGKEAFQVYDTIRAPGASTKRVEFGYSGVPYALENHAIESLVPDEIGRDAQLVPGLDLAQEAIGIALDAINLKTEFAAAAIATNAANYGTNNKMALSGTTLWSASTGTPKANVVAARSAIRAQMGVFPNVMILPPGGIAKLDLHPEVRDRLKYTGGGSATAEMLAAYFQVDKVVEANSVYAAGLTAGMSDVWGNNVILAYVAPGGITRSQRAPSFGYTYTLRNHPFVKKPYYENNRESWVYGVHYERAPVIAGNGAGFLIQNAF